MPRLIDHDQRRNEIAAALRRVVLREGMAAVSVRTVAAEAGWSPSAVRHWFPDQAALVRFAVARTMAEAPARLREVLAAGPSRENAQLLLEQLLPLDDVRRVEMHVWLAAVDPARHDDGFDETRSQMFVALRHVCRTAVARWCDLAPPASVGEVVDAVEQDAAVLHALLDGLALHGVHYPEEATPERIRAVLRHHLEAISTRSRL
ncbi:TetR/AcrR family transcriptional regulator [uncultured Nocardioides sp.]|uniref:TetR/AcrR family transcriptional regulator n=1 Tax=uncultured Nocardioides sp. TaxID=198441 RepID=UPI0025EE1D94|nr:TetR family transcriptional regulator C-terminal domain-containing protein [uncultured Nocardioides sp.]